MPEDTTTEAAQATTEATEETTATAQEQVTEKPRKDGGTILTPSEPEGGAGTPDKYDLKAPENSLLADDAIERIAAEARERGLSNELAQWLVERENAALSEYATAYEQHVLAEAAKWAEQAKTDPEIGGDSFKTNVELAKRVVDRFGSDELKGALNETGLGNHPELIRFVARIAKKMSEDTFVKPGAQESKERPIEDIFYGGTEEPKE